MIGQKGLPATYGGVEHHVEELGWRLAARGHHVDVFCRPGYGGTGTELYRGMHLRRAATIGTRHLDAIGHSVVSSLHSMRDAPDVVHYHALGPVLAAPLVRALSRSAVVVTVHGLDHERDKWGLLARGVLSVGHWMSARVPEETVVVSRQLQQHYAEQFGRRAVYIPNGVDAPVRRKADEITRRWGLTADNFVLHVGRLVPEKAADLLIRAYRDVPGDRPLVIAGDSSFTDAYVARLRKEADGDPRVKFCGYVFGDTLAELYSNAAVFVQPSRLEGLPLTLLEASSHGIPVVASDIAPHREILGRAASGLVPVGDQAALSGRITEFLGDPPLVAARVLREQVLRTFRWDTAAVELERVYLRAASRIARQRTGADVGPGYVDAASMNMRRRAR
jgi:glycosyltransferase involved in cell wall biosynthesis